MKRITNQTTSEVVSHDVAPFEVDTDASRYSRFGWLLILVGVGGFLLWALFAPLDKGVPLSGSVTKESSRKAVQNLQGGTVDDILVKEGDHVKAGQVLVRMNSVASKAAADIANVQLFTAQAIQARLKAERDGANTLTFPPELMARRNEPGVESAMVEQQGLFLARRQALQSELSAIDENIAGLQQQTAGLLISRDSKKQQIVLLKQQLDDTRDLAKEGYVARNRLLDLERTYMQMEGAVSEDNGNIGRIERQVAELRLRRNQRVQDGQKEIRAQLGDVESQVAAHMARNTAQQFELANTEVRAPVDGIVLGLNVLTKGGVVSPGFRMMDLVPVNDALIVEGQLPVNLVDKVHAGLKVELIFSAFNTNTTPHIAGEIVQVAADRIVDERSGQPYYKVRARVTPAGLKQIAAHKLDIVPGMPVEIFVKTGERTMMSYLLKPIFDRAKTSMSED